MPLSKAQRDAVQYGLPFMLFMFVGWYGLANVHQAKRELRGASKGIGSYEEMDPVERMRQRYGLGNHGSGGGEQQTSQVSAPEIRSLEEELQDTLKKVDIHNFDYKPVPRPEDEE